MLTQSTFTKNISIYQKYFIPSKFQKNLIMPEHTNNSANN